MVLRLATRGSTLALWQAHHVKRRLESAHDGLRVDLSTIRTTGDRITDVPLARIGDKGLFTKEVDRALLTGEADLAVHSLKDIPTTLEPGLDLGAVLEREDPRDAVVFAPDTPPALADLPDGARIGTSSLRRRAQLLHRRPDLQVVDLRGNLDTRLDRIAAGAFDAAILARAGLIRLVREEAVGEVLEPPAWLPAVGQGALAIAIRGDDDDTRRLLRPLDHADTRATTTAERSFLRKLEGGCQVPIGALANVVGDQIVLNGLVAALSGRPLLRSAASGVASEAAAVGTRLADALLDQGAADILEEIRVRAPGSLPGVSAP